MKSQRHVRLGIVVLLSAALTALPALGAPPQGVPRTLVGPGEGAEPPDRVGDADMLTLPNLVPLPPYDVFVGPAEQPQGPVWSQGSFIRTAPTPPKRALRFTTTIQNRGRYPFELVGTPWTPDSSEPDVTTTQAYQCVRFTGPILLAAQRTCVRYNSVGTLTWHAQHRHFHINGFGRYELRRDLRGKPDMSPRGRIGLSQKLGWCVSDMWNWQPDTSENEPDATLYYAADPYELSWYSECTSPVLYTGASWRQGISPGWADTYPALYTGQEIPLNGVSDGVYWIVTTINPKDNEFGLRVQETTWADNTSASKVQVYAKGNKARLLWPMPREPYKDWFGTPEDQPGQ